MHSVKLTIASVLSIIFITGSVFAQQGGEKRPLEKIFETEPVFRAPESVVYDPVGNVLYVSNFNTRGGFVARGDISADEYISKVGLDGQVITLKWAKGLLNPCGLAVYNKKLYAVERNALAEIHIPSGNIIARYPIPGARFPNDVAFDEYGTGYVTDNGNGTGVALYRFRDKKITPWIKSDILSRPNGICITGDRVMVGDMRDCALKAVSIKDKTVTTIVSLPEPRGVRQATIDGLVPDGKGGFIVSFFQGPAYLVSGAGKILATVDQGEFISKAGPLPYRADIGYIYKERLLIVPTLLKNSLYFYRWP